jgi:hypothetical protein
MAIGKGSRLSEKGNGSTDILSLIYDYDMRAQPDVEILLHEFPGPGR